MSKTFLDYFYEISAIPRPSLKEEKIADYLMRFAEAHSLTATRDDANNVLIRKPAYAGYENATPVLLQGHTDMVCEKNEGTVHDFDTEGIRILREGDILRADGTTLGADNGYAVAVMLAVLSDSTLPHPPLECLFTTAEEIGLDGMQAFDKSSITARLMINLDSCDETVATAACAGGVCTDFTRTPAPAVPADGTALRLTVSGLKGGHSGEDIHRGRGNALKICTRLYVAAKNATPLHMISISGGNKDNAIPRECSVLFTADDAQKAIVAIREEEAHIRAILSEDDRAFSVLIQEEPVAAPALPDADASALLSLIRLLPCGPLAMSQNLLGLVETSSNPAIVRADASHILVTISSRSSVDAELTDLCATLDTAAQVTGFESSHYSRYPGWDFTVNSRLQQIYLDTYRTLFGKEAQIIGIHAGLECGILKQAIPEMDILSIGPDLYDLHTPAERMSVSSGERVYQLLLAMLAALK